MDVIVATGMENWYKRGQNQAYTGVQDRKLLLRWGKCDTLKKECALAICNQYHNIQRGCNNHSK